MTNKLLGAAAVLLLMTISLAWPRSAQRPVNGATYTASGELQRPVAP